VSFGSASSLTSDTLESLELLTLTFRLARVVLELRYPQRDLLLALAPMEHLPSSTVPRLLLFRPNFSRLLSYVQPVTLLLLLWFLLVMPVYRLLSRPSRCSCQLLLLPCLIRPHLQRSK
jgi:hypothetical protein